MNQTPKDILLEQHHAIAAKLDRVSEGVLVTELSRPTFATRKNFATTIFQKLWLELIWPSRRAWAGLAVVWVVLAVVHLASAHNSPQSSINPQIIVANWREQEQLFAQLLNEHPAILAKPPAPAAPPPPPATSALWPNEENTSWA
jgi:hypothetical protein